MPDRPILFAGDPHGNFAPILRACLARPAGTLILVLGILAIVFIISGIMGGVGNYQALREAVPSSSASSSSAG